MLIFLSFSCSIFFTLCNRELKRKHKLHSNKYLSSKQKKISFRFPALQPPATNIKLSHIIKRKRVRLYTYLAKMDRDNANATRLRVNRIALIQQIDTQELIPKLIRSNIISADHDVQYINQGTSKIDRARRLIDCLLDKDSKHIHQPANWFLLFRSILLENSSVYQNLVTKLDNTIIRKPDFAKYTSQISIDKSNVSSVNESQENNDSSNTQKRITNIEFDRYAMNKFVIEGTFQKVIDNLTYYSQVCLKLFIKKIQFY